ncbi:BOI-related E3 ubiquitin-protein ligase 1-like [Salvia miltiorrhiza]|uniref:BOI-related E3 ubiquitin-protein ligase 1-like n=1 Tax=Salvia miltiorrhiza TaxID=226208 RepID=UPI0025AC6919|nr:BOI-related E3 ubiquitin-protein ligase 1-like [Salvia miltiorrhiza]
MFTSNAAAAKKLGKRKVREVTGETSAAAAHCFNPHMDARRRSQILNNAAAAAPFSYLALLTADDSHGHCDDDDDESCPFSKDIKNQSDKINQMIMFHSENLRQSVVGTLCAAEERAAKRLRASEARNAELERLAELYKGEAERLLMRVRYLEMSNAYAEEEEAESSFEDPDRVRPVRLDCKVCKRELAKVMLWPCRHVCVCPSCDAATKCCPVCRLVKTTSVQLSLPLD